MVKEEREALQKRVVQFYVGNANYRKSVVAKHFAAEGISRSTIYAMIKKYEDHGRVGDLPRSGRPAVKSTRKLKASIVRMFDGKDRISTRIAAARLNVSKSLIHRIKLKDCGIKSYRKAKAPKYINDQEARAEKNARSLSRKLRSSDPSTVLILDDESYFPKDPSQVAGLQFYHSSDKTHVPDKLKVKGIAKFPPRFLVWQALAEDGSRSAPFICYNQTITADVYLQHCIKERLIPFISANFPGKNVLFWPDLATAHYAADVTAYLRNQGIAMVDKSKNLPNCPHLRPIERYWQFVKEHYKKRKKGPKNLRSFQRMYREDSSKVADDLVKSIMGTMRKKIRKVGNSGVYSVK